MVLRVILAIKTYKLCKARTIKRLTIQKISHYYVVILRRHLTKNVSDSQTTF